MQREREIDIGVADWPSGLRHHFDCSLYWSHPGTIPGDGKSFSVVS